MIEDCVDLKKQITRSETNCLFEVGIMTNVSEALRIPYILQFWSNIKTQFLNELAIQNKRVSK